MTEYSNYTPGPPPAGQTSNLATVSLVSGVLGWTLLPLAGSIVAVITGHMAKNEIRRSGGQLAGDGLATAGLVLGYLNLGLGVVGFCLFALFLAGAISIPFLCLPFSNQYSSILLLFSGL